MKRNVVSVATLIRAARSDRDLLTKKLLEGGDAISKEERERLIASPILYSRETDMRKALKRKFNAEWREWKLEKARQWAAFLIKEFPEEFPDEIVEAHRIFRRDFRWAMRDVRIYANISICRCWVELLKRFPQYVDRCPWHVFQGDRIWQTLQDTELLRAINCTPLQLAEKMDLNAMTPCDWDEVIKIVPELASRRPKKDYDCYVI